MSVSTGSSTEIVLTAHCVERFNERFRPGLELSEAGDELERLLEACASVTAHPPAWMPVPLVGRDTESYALIGDDLVLPLVDNGGSWAAVTCLGRGGLSPEARSGRNQRARDRRRRRAARRRR